LEENALGIVGMKEMVERNHKIHENDAFLAKVAKT